MIKTNLSRSWIFQADGASRTLDLPHDYAIEKPRDPHAPGGAQNGFFDGGKASYTKYVHFDAPHTHRILNFDGSYVYTQVKYNGSLIATHVHGYTPFLVDLTPYVRVGHTDKIEVDTSDLMPSTRWYAGAGLYRDVFLWTGGEVRIEPWDLFVTTSRIGEKDAEINIRMEISADYDADATVILSVEGTEVTTSRVVPVQGGKKTLARFDLTIPEAKLWDLDHPDLYTLRTEILVNGVLTDVDSTTFGIRTIEADAENGFRLNGKPMKLRGGCIHHDHGALGSAEFPAAEERKLRKLKEAGFNALRIAHNPPSLVQLELCDRMGILLMDEAFDVWNLPKNPADYHLFFAQWWKQDADAMVLRDRNHPCIIAYSIGNEIDERDGLSDGAEWAKKIAEEFRRLDNTRLVTSGVCGLWNPPGGFDPPEYVKEIMGDYSYQDYYDGRAWADLTEGYCAPLDIVGYNYLFRRYRTDHERFPNRVMWGSETHALTFFDSWHETLACPHVIGDFTWTAYDNLGEAGTGRSCFARDGKIYNISLADYPWRNCYQGDLDLCGYRRPQSYFRESVWIGGKEPRIFTTHPEHYGEGFSGTGWHWYQVLDCWTFDDAYLGKPVSCDAYTDAEEIEWLINGRSLGRVTPKKGIANITVPYEKGELTAVAYQGGKEVSRYSLHTTGSPAKIELIPETESLLADNRDLLYLDLAITDANGDRIADSEALVTASVTGGKLMGIFSGAPKTTDEFTNPFCHAFEGRALVIISAAQKGDITVRVESEGLTPAEVTVRAL